MTRWSGVTTLLGGTILAAAFLSACGGDDDGATAAPSGCPTSNASVALAVGARSNVPQAQFPPVTLPSLRTAADNGKAISIIRIDGKPKVLSLPAFTTDAGNDRARGQALDTYIEKYVGPALAGPGDNSVHAQAGEANVLSALDLAASSVEKGGRIIMVDSGLQTTAPLDFRNPGQFSAEPSQVVDFLKQQGLLPDLTGKNVLLSGFGYTAQPQAPLNQKWRDNVISQWTAIVQAGGGCVEVDRRPNTAGVLANKPPVTPVTPPATVSFAGCGDTALTDADRVGFVTGTDKFTDPAGARTTLGRLAAKLKNGSQHVTLIGSTSSEGGDEINNPLSTKRADRVRAELVSLGISPDRITAKGVGAHLEGRADDRAADGSLLPGPAALNRKVVVRLPKCAP
jgi:OOP family OmpA-OmpF porin